MKIELAANIMEKNSRKNNGIISIPRSKYLINFLMEFLYLVISLATVKRYGEYFNLSTILFDCILLIDSDIQSYYSIKYYSILLKLRQ